MSSQTPEGPGHELLMEWALWNRGGTPGNGSSWSVKERLDPSHDDVPPERVTIIDGIVGRMGASHPQYLSMVKRFYLEEISFWEVAGRLKCTVGFVRLRLQAICDWVAREYDHLTGTWNSAKKDKPVVGQVAPQRNVHFPPKEPSGVRP